MKYEPLKEKKQKLKKNGISSKKQNSTDINDFRQGFEKGIDDSFDLFASFINLYKKYKNDVKLLMNEQKDVWSKWVKYYEVQSNVDNSNFINKYNEWLFDYIFSNINEESDGFLQL